MLLDEPLSALDLKLRQHMRSELRAIQKRTNVTFIYITHDQGEALAMSDRVGIMSHGVLQQVGVPQEIYNNPANGFVASFVGENNVFPGRVDRRHRGRRRGFETAFGTFNARLGPGIAQGNSAKLYVRPEHSILAPEPATGRQRAAGRGRPTSRSRAISSTSTPAAIRAGVLHGRRSATTPASRCPTPGQRLHLVSHPSTRRAGRRRRRPSLRRRRWASSSRRYGGPSPG